ncbi:hypothetical protein EJ06DRAFT_264283 [Trichodelitschia bisporula]|uniref:Zn(2)-C6 fungal-type domain-containing protein n=1 Tax=Trichodelitschia bisporula TaxID=703511 RepID=A0A6G1HIX8_9PEZI|nr:hypothetical protein EJ06DRAFT_264283 [Trichodelitschia bisporula]
MSTAAPPPPSASTNPKLRKRTKTGCLTCRKRRIKCGEERPTCGNCIKSKRHCEGYNHRVVFRPPAGEWGPGSSTLGPAPLGPAYTPYAPLGFAPPATLPYHSGMLPGAVRTLGFEGRRVEFGEQQRQQQPLGYTPGSTPLGTPLSAGFAPGSATFAPRGYAGGYEYGGGQPAYRPREDGYNFGVKAEDGGMGIHGDMNGMRMPQEQQQPQRYQDHATPLQTQHQAPHPSLHTPIQQQLPQLHTPQSHAQLLTPQPQPQSQPQSQSYYQFGTSNLDQPPHHEIQTPRHHTQLQAPLQTPQHHHAQLQPVDPWPPGNSTYTDTFPTSMVSPTQMLEEAAVEYEDDDYYDVQSDEEMEIPPDATLVRLGAAQSDFKMILDLHRGATSDTLVRGYDAFIHPGILDFYRAEWVANPLKNPRTARVFAHFVFATGPTLSIFERLPRNASALFTDTPVPTYQQGLWTYTLPLMALNHQGLLHAMLALASLHIAKLQGASITPSFKHYAYALKRIHHCVGHAKKRHLPTTLAATLLLGFYEVLTADHLKWSSHLLGAKQLIVEIDFKGMAKAARRAKYSQPSDADRPDTPPVDEALVGTIVGSQLRYDNFGSIEDASQAERRFDMAQYELYQDLFWWYAKQDAYQSIVSGNRLLLDYSRWADCPPRASFGRADAVYATNDHLMLLLGRVADFAARDRKRKLKAMEATGGQWYPPGVPSQATPPGGASSRPQGPQFFGMAPLPTNPHMPSSYASNHTNHTPSPRQSPRSDSSFDLSAATAAATEEWKAIGAALQAVKAHFGPAFQPLGPEFHAPTPSPFGPALHYRSYDVAVIWATYYMCHIILVRAHPQMPPAAMMAAGVAAPRTDTLALEIGRVAAGIMPLSEGGGALNPSLGAALCDICMPLFFAGVQYQDAAQREWLVRHVRDVERRTGWASVGMIAQGCETAWEKAAEANRGPPYVRTREVWHLGRGPVGTVEGEEKADARVGNGKNGIVGDMSDRRFVHVNPATRVHWAMGLLSEEDDVKGDLQVVANE